MNVSNKPIILFIDHDPEIDRTVNVIKDLYDDERRKLVDDFDVQFLCIPSESDIYESLLEKYSDNFPALVLIDFFYMDNRQTTNAFNTSLIRVKELHDRLWGIPLGVFTKETLKIEERISIECNDISPVLDGFYDLTRTDKRVIFTIWRNCLRERIENHQKNQNLFPSHIVKEKVEWEQKPYPNLSPTVEKILCYLVDKALSSLPDKPHRIRIKLLGDGYSTAFLLLATLYDKGGSEMAKRYVIKADENPAVIESEFLGHQTMQQKVNRRYYLPLAVGAKEPVEFRKDYWAAFVMEHAEGMTNLLNQTMVPDNRLSEIYDELFRKGLFPLYSPVLNKEVEIGAFFKPIVWERANEGINSIEPYFDRMKVEDKKTSDMLSVGKDFIKNKRIDLEMHIQSSWAKNIHGDLNCRNILLSSDLREFLLIDFPFSKDPECLAKDFVRAETELLLFLFEKQSGRDTDIELVIKWLRFLETNDTSFLEFAESHQWPEANRIIRSIKMIRRCYIDIAVKNKDTEKVYYWYLISRFMLCLNFNYIPASKRLLGLVMISKILGQINR